MTVGTAFIGGGKRGNDVRSAFDAPPYGWPREAVDGALLALLGADLISAQVNGSPVTPKGLDGSKIGSADFRSQNVVITTLQRIQIRKVLSAAGVNVRSGEELQGVPQLLSHMRSLASAAGGNAPAPVTPDIAHLETIKHLSGNEQLMAIFEARERLLREMEAWQREKEKMDVRLSRWTTLKRLLQHAQGLSVTDTLRAQVRAVEQGRLLLNDPDPLPPLSQALTSALRERLKDAYRTLGKTYAHELKSLTETETWKALPSAEAQAILQRNNLKEPKQPALGGEAELLSALEHSSLADLENRTAAI